MVVSVSDRRWRGSGRGSGFVCTVKMVVAVCLGRARARRRWRRRLAEQVLHFIVEVELEQTQGGEYDRHERHSCAVETAAAPLRWLLLRNQRRGFIR